MKRLLKAIVFVLLMIPLTVYAEKVTELNTTVEGKKIMYSGTIENGATAVMCHLFDADDNDIDNLSSAVDSNAFNGEFVVENDGTYKVSCAKYEGGETKVVEAIVGEVPEVVQTSNEVEKDTSKGKSPKTYDDINTYITIAGVSVFVLAGVVAYFMFKKKEVKNN